jgi:pyridinium-3,5-bisthiocarboxylic acid mononucleotide nickel chelatase
VRAGEDGIVTSTGTGTTTAWFQCHAGVAGDMVLGALVDAGADAVAVADMLGGLGVDGWALMFERTQRCGIASTRALVAVHGGHERPATPGGSAPHDHDHHEHDHHADENHDSAGDHATHRTFGEIRALLTSADLPVRVRERSLAVMTALAEAEAHLHGTAVDDVELHEVGSLDAIIDVVGVCAALEVLGIDRITCSTIAVGHGSVRSTHGEIANPAPATVALLARVGAPTRGLDDHRELATPTGVALMTVLADNFGALPEMNVQHVGYGAGSMDIEGRPNVVQVIIGEAMTESVAPSPGRNAVHYEANVDDTTGEVLAHSVAALLAAGAHDAWVSPIIMKKGRPAHTVHALCDAAVADAVAAVMVSETGTLGLRASTVTRWPQMRHDTTVEIEGHSIRVKVTADRVKVEFDDAAAASHALDRPLRDVIAAAEAAARSVR